MKNNIKKITLFILLIVCIFIMIFITCEHKREDTYSQTVDTIEVLSVKDENIESSVSEEEIVTVSIKEESIDVDKENVQEPHIMPPEQEPEPEFEIEDIGFISLGEFKLTAYCSCSICCGIYAYNRPVDEYGNDIVYGSTGERLIEGVSIAVDPNVIPYLSEVIINGHTYIAHDTGGAINGNRIDVYHSSHQEALNFGVQYAEVYIVDKSN